MGTRHYSSIDQFRHLALQNRMHPTFIPHRTVPQGGAMRWSLQDSETPGRLYCPRRGWSRFLSSFLIDYSLVVRGVVWRVVWEAIIIPSSGAVDTAALDSGWYIGQDDSSANAVGGN